MDRGGYLHNKRPRSTADQSERPRSTADQSKRPRSTADQSERPRSTADQSERPASAGRQPERGHDVLREHYELPVTDGREGGGRGRRQQPRQSDGSTWQDVQHEQQSMKTQQQYHHRGRRVSSHSLPMQEEWDQQRDEQQQGRRASSHSLPTQEEYGEQYRKQQHQRQWRQQEQQQEHRHSSQRPRRQALYESSKDNDESQAHFESQDHDESAGQLPPHPPSAELFATELLGIAAAALEYAQTASYPGSRVGGSGGGCGSGGGSDSRHAAPRSIQESPSVADPSQPAVSALHDARAGDTAAAAVGDSSQGRPPRPLSPGSMQAGQQQAHEEDEGGRGSDDSPVGSVQVHAQVSDEARDICGALTTGYSQQDAAGVQGEEQAGQLLLSAAAHDGGRLADAAGGGSGPSSAQDEEASAGMELGELQEVARKLGLAALAHMPW
jgi:hypothetical protein